jgi:hypothetical protein
MTKSSFEHGHGLRHNGAIGSTGKPMSFLSELLAAIVLWLSATALCQFGVVIEEKIIKPKVERTVARSPREAARLETAPKIVCPEQAARLARA